jgi:RND family efflux transporter MFP subunit
MNDLKLPVLMRLANEEEFKHEGIVNFVDNRLNGNTGTIRLRAVFANPRGIFKAGLFVRVQLPLGEPYETLLIPDEALISDQGKKYVYVVNSDNVVVYRQVALGQVLEGLRAIKFPPKGKESVEGVQVGERVIISGMQRVRTGQQVNVTMKRPRKAPESPLKKLLQISRSAANKEAEKDVHANK